MVRNNSVVMAASWNESTTSLPLHLFDKQSSPDIFLIAEKETNVVRLAKSDHAGHQFFRCLAELKRDMFVDGDERFSSDETETSTTSSKSDDEQRVKIARNRNRVAMYLVSTICGNGSLAQIHIFSSDSGEWKHLTDPREAEMFVKEALQAYFLPSATLSTPKSSTTEVSSKEESNKQLDDKERSSKKRCYRASILEAAETLLLVLNTDSRPTTPIDEQASHPPQRANSPSLPPKKRIRFNDENAPTSSFLKLESATSLRRSNNISIVNKAPDTPKKMISRQENHIINKTTNKPFKKTTKNSRSGISIDEITANDVLCGGPKQGVLQIPNHGNVLFHKLVDAKLNDFYSQGKEDKLHMLRMSQWVVRIMNVRKGSRFLVLNPETNLWYEVKPEKAWGKAYRTFVSRQPDGCSTLLLTPEQSTSSSTNKGFNTRTTPLMMSPPLA